MSDCPVCNSTDTRPDLEPDSSITVCDKCGSEWVHELEITLDARDYFTEEENQKLNRNQKNQ
jgi:transcription initiation factor TFIIIB Brf1 subunit/transcription initiation factor TFIIB